MTDDRLVGSKLWVVVISWKCGDAEVLARGKIESVDRYRRFWRPTCPNDSLTADDWIGQRPLVGCMPSQDVGAAGQKIARPKIVAVAPDHQVIASCKHLSEDWICCQWTRSTAHGIRGIELDRSMSGLPSPYGETR